MNVLLFRLDSRHGDFLAPVRACNFTRAPLNLPVVTVRFEVGRDAADFATIRKNHEEHGQPTKDFPGLGDGAAIVSMDGKDLGVTYLCAKDAGGASV